MRCRGIALQLVLWMQLHLSFHSKNALVFARGLPQCVGVSPRRRARAGDISNAALLLRDVGISLPALPAEDMDEEGTGDTHSLRASNQAEAVLAAMAADVPLRRALLQVRMRCLQHVLTVKC